MDNTYLIILYDYYGELLTLREKEYFESYYFDNLSLSEISNNLNVSRNAISKSLKTIKEKLNTFEEKLKLYEKDKKLKKIIKIVKDKTILEMLKELE